MITQEYIIDTLRSFLGYLGISITAITPERDEKTGSLRIVVSTPDSALLIGEHGARLKALNHVLKRMTEKTLKEEDAAFYVDVNDYQKKHIDDIRAKAHILAERARYFKSSVDMDPMSSYERMIVHAEFSDVPDIKTESSGYGKDRHITIIYSDTQTTV